MNSVAGVIYGIALALEREHRKEGATIAVWSVVMLGVTYLITSWLQAKGILPTFIVSPTAKPSLLSPEVQLPIE
ncbi:MAG: hypothetical protein HYV25_00355 [Candidatus Harrisonbacteria bacterium]|nr:hypothetical protein [Candidatus Harrisonbacteria bacterium]